MFDPAKGFMFQNLEPHDMLFCLDEFDKSLKSCCEFWGFDYDKVEYPIPTLTRIYNRIEQRRDYYLYFHSRPCNPMKMSETKQAALLAFWVIKYKPLTLSDDNDDTFAKHDATLNELFAVFIIHSIATELSVRKDIDSYFNHNVLRNMAYNFAHRDLSKEAIIFYINALLGEAEL